MRSGEEVQASTGRRLLRNYARRLFTMADLREIEDQSYVAV